MNDMQVPRVLIVDDDLSLEPLWRLIIRRCCPLALIEWAVSSEQAKKLIRDLQNFDLIITDLFLAGSATGLDFLKSQEVASLHAKTVLVSMAPRQELEAYCAQGLPSTKILAKPLNVVKYENALAEMFYREKAP